MALAGEARYAIINTQPHEKFTWSHIKIFKDRRINSSIENLDFSLFRRICSFIYLIVLFFARARERVEVGYASRLDPPGRLLNADKNSGATMVRQRTSASTRREEEPTIPRHPSTRGVTPRLAGKPLHFRSKSRLLQLTI